MKTPNKLNKFKVAIPSKVTTKWLDRYVKCDNYSKYNDIILDRYKLSFNQNDIPKGCIRVTYFDYHSTITAKSLIEELQKYPADTEVVMNNRGFAIGTYMDVGGNIHIADQIQKTKVLYKEAASNNNAQYDALDAIAKYKMGKDINRYIRSVQLRGIRLHEYSNKGAVLVPFPDEMVSCSLVKKFLCEMYNNATGNDVSVEILSVNMLPGSPYAEVELVVSKKA